MYILILYSEDLLLLTDIFLASFGASMQRKTTLDLSNYFLYFLILFFVVYILFCIFNLFNLLSGQYNHLFFMEKEENKKIEIIPSSGINLERIISLHSLSPVLPETQADTTITVTNKSGKYVYVFSLCDEQQAIKIKTNTGKYLTVKPSLFILCNGESRVLHGKNWAFFLSSTYECSKC